MRESLLKEAVLYIDSEALKSNFDWFKQRTQSSFVCPMIKANAYGLGDSLVYDILSEHGVKYFGMARLSEALNLRAAEKNIRGHKNSSEILLFNAFSEKDLELMLENRITPVVSSQEQVRCLQKFLENKDPDFNSLKIHLELDVGMNRLGLKEEKDLEGVLKELSKFQKPIYVEGIFSHFSHAEDWGDEKGVSVCEEKRFQKMVNLCMDFFERRRDLKADPFFIHLPSSRALENKDVCEIESSLEYGIRPGIGLYGLSFSGRKSGLKPVLSLRAPIVDVRLLKKGEKVSYGGLWTAPEDVEVAVLPMGYGDGYPRSLMTDSYVLFEGEKIPIVGAICMDFMMICLSQSSLSRELRKSQLLGEMVTLIGSEGPLEVTVEELAQKSNQISYEFISGLSHRLLRKKGRYFFDSRN